MQTVDALFGLAFAAAPGLPLSRLACTDSQAHSSIGTGSGFNALPHLVSTRFQDLFHSPPGVLFTFPSRYSCAIGSRRVFSLAGRSPRLRTGFHVSRLTPSRCVRGPFGYGALTPFGAPFQRLPLGLLARMRTRAVPLSLATTQGIESLFLLLPVLGCFRSRGCPPRAICSRGDGMHRACRVSPFGDPGIEAHVQLPRAYRRLSRPSSSSGSKASAARLISFRPAHAGPLPLLALASCFCFWLMWSAACGRMAGPRTPSRHRFLYARFYFRKNYGIQFSRRMRLYGAPRIAPRKPDGMAVGCRAAPSAQARAGRRCWRPCPFLRRKEVIHPLVLEGIPCFDLTPITGPALDAAPPCGLGKRFRALPALMV